MPPLSPAQPIILWSLYLRGKQKWVSLDTTVLTVAKLRLPDEVKKIEKRRATEPNVHAGRATMAELMEVYMERTRANSDLKPASIVSHDTALKKIKETWPRIEERDPAEVTPRGVLDWAARPKERWDRIRS
jgi:hypothetical protein